MLYEYRGLGSLHQAPDGIVYQVQNPAPPGLAQDELIQVMGLGAVGEVRQGPDGNLYQWVTGADGLGNPVGFWNVIPAIARAAAPLLQNVARPLLQAAQPLLQQATNLLRPGAAPVATAPVPMPMPVPMPTPAYAPGSGPRVDPEDLMGMGCGVDGLAQAPMYQSSDGTLYQVQGLDEDEEYVRGLDEDEEYVRGLDEDEEYVRGLDEDLPEEERGVSLYVPRRRERTRWSARSRRPPEMWRPPW